MPFFKRSLAGPGYIILNTLRVMNIIGLTAVIAASCVMLVKTFVVSKFFFFDGVSHVISASLSCTYDPSALPTPSAQDKLISFFVPVALIITELPLFRSYLARCWPLLSPTSGFVTLGTLMIILGVSVLGNLNKEATSEKSLGTSAWQIVISSGIVVVILGAMNIFANFMFRNKSMGITARQVRAHGAVAPQKVAVAYSPSSATSQRRSFHLGRSDTLPSYHTGPRTEIRQQQRNISAPITGSGRNISSPITEEPSQFSKFSGAPQIERPDLAHHPAMMGGSRF